jgi:hypothetical protein
MVGRSPDSDDCSMFPDAFIPLGQVPATASRLQRAANELRQRAGSPNAVPSLPVTLVHVEEALDQLAESMRVMAQAAAEWCAEDGASVDEDRLKPEAQALLWHLQAVADTLDQSRDACPATREWARRLLDAAAEPRRPRVTRASDRGPRASALPRRGGAGMEERIHATGSGAHRS